MRIGGYRSLLIGVLALGLVACGQPPAPPAVPTPSPPARLQPAPTSAQTPLSPPRQAKAAVTAQIALPAEVQETVSLIQRGGPFPYRRDGITFQNREHRLPKAAKGYYREYTVPTPGERDRGARRVITGGEPIQAYFYTPDHYRSFYRLEVRP